MIKIKNTLRQDNANMEAEDVLKVKTALAKTGHYEIPDYGITKYPDKRMFDAIKNFQDENDLKKDGVITPEGPTLQALNRYKTNLPEDDLPGVRSPSITCTVCGGPHGGSKGDLCPSCDAKS